ncbi:MAG: SH3 domain-containing protein [Turicibacter sp.]|nr:SH3 domain-containing protein [Turicibacter sp.]MDO5793624.1 SH3 domain-containing protein [Turicibacter sp.]
MKGSRHHIPVYQYTWTSLRLRADKSVLAEVLTVIPSHTKFEVIEADSLWLKVIYDEQIGYVFKQAVSVSELLNQGSASVQSSLLQII